jgi:AmmeMemoRadiSam system protein B/AmmeMemoRadiSam system protein A
MTRVKLPDVAGRFYPAEADALRNQLAQRLAAGDDPAIAPKLAIVPHAGYPFSAPIAASAYRLLARRRGEIRRVVLFGPAHRTPFRGMAVLPVTHWRTPLGQLATDGALMQRALQCPEVVAADAPFLNEHSLEVQLPFIQQALGDVTILPVLVGQVEAGKVARLMDMLWGGPETLVLVSSDLSHYHDYDAACVRDAATSAMIERAAPDRIGPQEACGHLAVRAAIAHARARDLRITALDVRNSGDTAGDRARVVGYGSFAFEYAHAARLPEDDRAHLLAAARDSIRTGLETGRPATPPERELPCTLQAQRNTFVTLEIDGRLRGCIGSMWPQRGLAADVCENAFKAAFADPRFPQLTPGEVDRLQVSVSLLSHPRPIAADSEDTLVGQLRPDMDGLILSDGPRRALFLPSVWRSLPDARRFVRELKRKAGMPAEGWSPTMQAQRFGAEYFGHAPA